MIKFRQSLLALSFLLLLSEKFISLKIINSISNNRTYRPKSPPTVDFGEIIWRITQRINMKRSLCCSLFIVFPLIVLLSSFGDYNNDGPGAEANFFTDLFKADISQGPSFRSSRLYLLENLSGFEDDVGLRIINGTVECYGDFNSDQ
jgi:hypothetical protein